MLNSEIPVSASARSSTPLCYEHQAAIAWARARADVSEARVAELKKELCVSPAGAISGGMEMLPGVDLGAVFGRAPRSLAQTTHGRSAASAKRYTPPSSC